MADHDAEHLRQARRRLAVCYSADAPAIGVDRDDAVQRERCRVSAEAELRLLRERASCSSYG